MSEVPKRHFVLEDEKGNSIEYNNDLTDGEIVEIFQKLDNVRGSKLHVYTLQKTYGEIK